MKDSNDVIHEFNDLVNMTASEIEKWLKSDDSRSAGWPKEDESGESVGHDSGRKIVEILKSNPNKDPEKYTDDQVAHMRKVVSYCKRHLAQEKKSHENKSTEEVKQTKSYASLKNWGHDPLKGKENDDGSKGDDAEEEDADGDIQENTEQAEDDKKQAGDKRKKNTSAQSGTNKKRETRQGKATSNGNKKKQDDDNDDEDEDYEEEQDDDDDNQETNGNDDNEEEEEDDGDDDDSGQKPKKGPKPGDKVTWAWGNGHPEGKVLDVKGEKTSVTTKRGNEVSRHGDPEDPAVVLDTGKSKAIKSNHELD